jgi:hypothetical protein
MAGLVPAIHVFCLQHEDVDARHKAGHVGLELFKIARGAYVAKLS